MMNKTLIFQTPFTLILECLQVLLEDVFGTKKSVYHEKYFEPKFYKS